MPKATKLPSGNWRVNLYLGKKDGKEIRRSITGKTKKEAEQRAALYTTENHLDDSPMTVGEAVDKYIKDSAATLSPSSIRGYRTIRNNQISGIKSFMTDKVTQNDLQTWINDLSRRLSAKTVKNACALVCSSIRSIRPNFNPSLKLPAKDAQMVVIPTEEDVRNMLKAANPKLKKCIMLGAFCGMRRGEICYLRYKDIKNGTISIHGDMVKNSASEWEEKDHAKTAKSNRTVRVPGFVLEELGSGDPDAHVIEGTPDSITSSFTRLMKKLGLPYHFHLLRHFFASTLIAQGVPRDYIQALGGWENGGSLDRVYTHILQSSQNEFSDKVSDYFSKIYNG